MGIKQHQSEKDIERKLEEFLRTKSEFSKKIESGDYIVEFENLAGGYRFDLAIKNKMGGMIAVFDIERFDIKIFDIERLISRYNHVLMYYPITPNIKVFIAIPNNKTADDFELIKVPTYLPDKIRKTMNMLEIFSLLSASLTAVVFALGELNVIILNYNFIILWLVIVVMFLAPWVKEINFLGLSIKNYCSPEEAEEKNKKSASM